jgi:hypothetical protein
VLATRSAEYSVSGEKMFHVRLMCDGFWVMMHQGWSVIEDGDMLVLEK